jgi:hypothetical protein
LEFVAAVREINMRSRNYILCLTILAFSTFAYSENAVIRVSSLDDPSNIIMESESTIPGTQVAAIPDLDPDTMYLVTATGYLDLSGNSTTWHALVLGSRLSTSSANVTILTEAYYRFVEPLFPDEGWLLQSVMDTAARLTVTDVNQNGSNEYDDVLAWDRQTQESLYLGTEEELNNITEALASNVDLSAETALIFATVEASDVPMQKAVAGDTDARRFDYTINPLPDSILLNSSLFTVTEITRVKDEYPTVWYYGQGDTDGDSYPEIYISGWTAFGPDENGLPPKAIFEAFEAQPEGTVSLSTTNMFGRNTTDGTAFIRVEDFDLDGRNDVLVAGHNEIPFVNTENILYINDGDGTFTARSFGPFMTNHDGNLGDFNQDGYPDLIAAAYTVDLDFSSDPGAAFPSGEGGANMLFLNDHNGGFEAWALRFNVPTQGLSESELNLNKFEWIAGGSAAVIGNIDADPEMEIVVVDSFRGPPNYTSSESVVVDNIQFESSYIHGDVIRLPSPFMETHEEFQAPENEFSYYDPSHDTQVDLLDFDNDGDQDILIYSQIWNKEGYDNAGSIQFLRNDGSSDFVDVTESVLYNYNTGTTGGHEVRYMDVNDDGFVDIVSAEESYPEEVEEWPDSGSVNFASIPRSWANMVFVNTGNGKFVTSLWQGYDDFVQQFIATYESYGEDVVPYSLVQGRFFPYMTSDTRLGFVTTGSSYENWTYFFDIRANNQLYTGPKGSNPAARGAPGFNEYFYLTEYPEVANLVSNGTYADGLAHYLDVGETQGKKAFAPNARLHGSESDDVFRLREGDESALGYAGNDTFYSGAGNNTIEGGEGVDRVIYASSLSGFQVSINGTTVALSNGNNTINDVLTDVEEFEFAGEVYSAAELEAAKAAYVIDTSATAPITGLWWNDQESGWGVTLTQQFGIIFATIFTYDDEGFPIWYVASNCTITSNQCSGDLYKVTGGSAIYSDWNGENKEVTDVGDINLSFQDADNAVMIVNIDGVTGQKAISRQVFSTLSPGATMTALWWNKLEDGWGVTVNRQTNIAFATIFSYDSFGSPTWHVASNCVVDEDGCSGLLYDVTGGSPITADWDGSNIVVTEVGEIRFDYTSSDSGVMNFSFNGIDASKEITRQIWATQ